ncbi:MAG: general secretion pathway protein GspB [Parahaliea sp.]
MSLILDAINRSQREQAVNSDVPGLENRHYQETTTISRHHRIHMILIAALIVALIVIGWLLLKPAVQERRASVEPVIENARIANSTVVAPVVSSPPETAKTARHMESAPVNAAASSPEQATAVTASAYVASGRVAPSVEGAAASAKPSARSSAKVAALYAGYSDVAAEPDTREQYVTSVTVDTEKTVNVKKTGNRAEVDDHREEALDVASMLAMAQSELAQKEAQVQIHVAPFISELSQQRKDAIPTLLYSAHNYRGQGGASTVLINGKTVRAGENIGKGVRVDEILPDAVVLRFQGEQFRLRALNSWVNL